jgi:hypothetical protein
VLHKCTQDGIALIVSQTKKSEIPKTARFVCEKKYPQRAKYYVYRKILYIPQCTVSNCMGRTTRAEIKFDGTTPTLYIERMLTDCDIEVVADEEKPIWCDTKFLKPPTLDK